MSGQAPYQDARFTSRDGLSLYYRDYAGAGSGLPALCIPGMPRNSKDFEDLAPRLASGRRVLSVDLRGRGHSDYDPDFKNYNPRTYADDIWELLDHAGVPEVVVVGTSLGGIMAMLLSTQKPERIGGAILNDIGPVLEKTGLDRISGYVNSVDHVADWDQAVSVAREANEAFLPNFETDDWLRFARRVYVEAEDGGLRPDHDPGIGKAMQAAGGGPTEMWPIFEGLKAKHTLVIRGALSDLLSEAGIDRMAERKPDLNRVTIPLRGHVPDLSEPECLTAIDRFFESKRAVVP